MRGSIEDVGCKHGVSKRITARGKPSEGNGGADQKNGKNRVYIWPNVPIIRYRGYGGSSWPATRVTSETNVLSSSKVSCAPSEGPQWLGRSDSRHSIAVRKGRGV